MERRQMAMPPSNSAAITGTFCDYRLVKTRGVLQLIVEIPVEQQAQAFAALGYPMPGTEIPVAMVRLTDAKGEWHQEINAHLSPASVRSEPERPGEEMQPEPQAEPGRPLPTFSGMRARARAVMLCKDPQFQKWVHPEGGEAEARAFMHRRIGGSRSLIATNEQCYLDFLELEQEYHRCVG